MEMYLYDEEIKKLKMKHDDLIKDFKSMGIVLTIMTVSIFIVLLFLNYRLENTDYIMFEMLFVFIISTIDVVIMVLHCERKKRAFYYDEVNQVVINVLRGESNLEIINKKSHKEYLSELRETRVQDGDFISLYNAFDFKNDDINGTIYNVIFSRSNGKASYETLRGLVLRFKATTSLNVQVRNDMFAPFKLKKDKEETEKPMRVYLPKKEEGKFSEIAINCFNILKEKFDAQSVGVDIRPGEVVFYINFGKNMVKIKSFDQKNIEKYCNMFVNSINVATELKEKIEGEF